jgi:hypothetical protein
MLVTRLYHELWSLLKDLHFSGPLVEMFFNSEAEDGETEPGGDWPTADSLVPKVELQVPPLRYPGFPVHLRRVGELHAAFESRIRRRGRHRDVGNPGPLLSG